MEFTLEVRNFRGLRRVEWTPSGVCAVVGPNGSGKTTLIDVMQLLRDALVIGFTKAIELHGGAYGMRSFGAPPDEPILFRVSRAGVRWEFQPEVVLGPGGARVPARESLWEGDAEVLSRTLAPSTRPRFEKPGMADQLLLDRVILSGEVSKPIEELGVFVMNSFHYRHYGLAALRREGSPLSGDLRLQDDGRNLFAVLMNWRNRRDHLERWQFVMRHLRACFPELLADFSFPIAANIVSCEIHTQQDHTLTPALMPDGFLVALLHLCAVASTEEGYAVSIDEPENALHPFAIRRVMDAFREWSDQHGVTVLLATHSPVLLDTFKEHPEKVFVMEPGHEVLPVPLDKLKTRNWLAHFSLGDLYEHLKYGAPSGVEEE